MKVTSIISIVLLLLTICLIVNMVISGRAAYDHYKGTQKNKFQRNASTLLAIFAHPDDELLTGAALAHYASEGAKVYVVIATDGALGTTDFSNIPAGSQLVKKRHEEMICSAKALGVEPIFIGLPDQLDAKDGKLLLALDSLKRAVFHLMDVLQPDAVITFGAEGWTGHPDHRLVGNIVTEVFASKRWPGNPSLYYSALPTGTINDNSWAKYLTVDSAYLTVRVPLSTSDYSKLRNAFNCHQTQYRESVRKRLPLFLEQTQNRVAMFRPLLQTGKIRNSIF